MGTSGSTSSSSLFNSASRSRNGEHHHSPSIGKFSRRAHHAGSWYDSSPSELDSALSQYLEDALVGYTASSCGGGTENGHSGSAVKKEEEKVGVPRAVVAPHAGYRYSGPTAAFAYHALREAALRGEVERIVVLHPSHYVRLDGCAVSGASAIETPLDDLPVDDDLRTELLATGKFTVMERLVDEREHSGEMQYPFIAKALREARTGGRTSEEGHDKTSQVLQCPVLPIMVGGLDATQEAFFGKLLAPILSRPKTFTIISSDFCHWGTKFAYIPHDKSNGDTISEYIEWLDRRGMDHIQMQNPGAFADYLREYSNTICGRHPIAVWLNVVKANREGGGEQLDVKFVRYEQSSQVRSRRESSVSYASAVARAVA